MINSSNRFRRVLLRTLLSACMLIGHRAFAQEAGTGQTIADSVEADQPVNLNEISFGIGPAVSFEKDIFNVPNDVAGGTNFGIAIGYLRNLDENFAVGVDMYGFFKSVSDATVIINGVSKNLTLNVSTFNIGALGRYFFSTTTPQPYGFVVLSYAGGTLSNEELGNLNFEGISGGGGVGVNLDLGPSLALSFEGLASFGTAKWDQPPFTNSTSTDFNPSMLMVLAKITYLWE